MPRVTVSQAGRSVDACYPARLSMTGAVTGAATGAVRGALETLNLGE